MNESGDAGHPAFLVLEHDHKAVQECWSMGPGLLLAWSASVLTMIGAFFILCGGGTTPVIREYSFYHNTLKTSLILCLYFEVSSHFLFFITKKSKRKLDSVTQVTTTG